MTPLPPEDSKRNGVKTLFVAAGDISWGSSRMRAWWPAKYMDGAKVVLPSQAGPDKFPLEYDAYIFQKLANPQINRTLLEHGKQVWWDVCDPAWWFQPDQCREIASTVTGAVASSCNLALDFNSWFGKGICEHIPDRLELGHFPFKRNHQEHKTIRLVWFGVSVNRFVLFGALANLERLAANGYAIELTIFDNQPKIKMFECGFPVKYKCWRLEQENEILSNQDIAVLPPYPGPWGAVKSNNKQLTAWACGLPVWDGLDYETGRVLISDPVFRKVSAAEGFRWVEDNYQVEQSAREWEALLGC